MGEGSNWIFFLRVLGGEITQQWTEAYQHPYLKPKSASVYIIGQTTSFLTYFNVNMYSFFIVLKILYKDSKVIKTDVLLNMHFDTDVQYQTFFGIEHN